VVVATGAVGDSVEGADVGDVGALLEGATELPTMQNPHSTQLFRADTPVAYGCVCGWVWLSVVVCLCVVVWLCARQNKEHICWH
jgi:hypothetical protein